jgi:hypothetical protein
MAISNTFAVRMHAIRIFNNNFPQIADALESGAISGSLPSIKFKEKIIVLELLWDIEAFP